LNKVALSYTCHGEFSFLVCGTLTKMTTVSVVILSTLCTLLKVHGTPRR
jgi:hypothetical protein